MSGLNFGVGGVWKTGKPFVGVGGVWKAVQAGFVGVGGVWKQFYSAVTIIPSVSTSGWQANQDEVGNILSWFVIFTLDSVAGGTAPYTYHWDNGTTGTTVIEIDDPDGSTPPPDTTMGVTVTDANGVSGHGSATAIG